MTDGQTYDPAAQAVVDWHEAFANERRQLVVKLLFERPADDPPTVADLARELETWLNSHTDAEFEYRHIRRGLKTSHLPKLDSAGIIDWSDDTIERGPEFAAAVQQLALDIDRQ